MCAMPRRREYMSTKKCFLITTIFVAVLSGGLVFAVEPTVQWELFSVTLRAYFKNPIPENAKTSYQHLPAFGHVNYKGDAIEDETLELIKSNLSILEHQVISRDEESVRLAFRLFSISDGDGAEQLDILLGKLIRVDPTLFLKELVANQRLTTRVDGLLGNEGEEYVDNFKAQCKENRRRRKALQSVKDRQLRRKRDECTRELDRHWHAYCGANLNVQSDDTQSPASGQK